MRIVEVGNSLMVLASGAWVKMKFRKFECDSCLEGR